jgi:regulator of sigma E protease
MLDEREGEVPASQRAQAFNNQSVYKRIAIVFAGPLANLILCVTLLWAMFVIGRPDYAPVVGQVDGIAAEAGLRPGDTLLAVGDRATPTWSDAQMALIPAALDHADVRVQVRTAAGSEAERELRLSSLPAEFDERRAVEAIGLTARHELAPALIGRVVPDSAGWGVLAEGDVITAIDGEPIARADEVRPAVQRLGERGVPAMVEVRRDGERLALELAPRRMQDPQTGDDYWGLGIALAAGAPPAKDAVLRYGPVAAVPAALREGVHQTREIFAMIGRAFSGKVSVENTVAGPITIARAANAYASHGAAWYLSMLAMLSLSLGILNLLPIPILDGGHLLYYLIELVKGSPVSERVMAAGQYVGLALIASLMGLAFYNDIVNNLVR